MDGSLDYAAWCVSRKRQIMLESMLDEVKMVTSLCRNRLLSAPPLHMCVTMFECRFGHFFHPRGGGLGSHVTPPNERREEPRMWRHPTSAKSVKLSPGTVSRESAAVSHERVGRARVDETVHLPHERLGCRRRLLFGQGGHDSIEVFVGGVEQPLS